MTDLRKAAEMALEVMEYNRANGTPNMGAAIEALRQALAQEATMQVTGEAFVLDRGCWERGCVAYDERDGDGVNIIEAKLKEKNT